jgi:hypothetical protein
VSGPEEREGAPEPYASAKPFRPAKPDPLLQRAIPVAKELPGYRAPTARRDLLAGVTVAALAIPSAMAYAELAGLPAVAGLYALLLPTVAYAFLGSSRQLIVGPEGSLSALVAAAVLALATAGSPEALELAGAMALLVAACFPDRAGLPARLAGRLPLPTRARGLHPRCRRRADRRPARQAHRDRRRRG